MINENKGIIFCDECGTWFNLLFIKHPKKINVVDFLTKLVTKKGWKVDSENDSHICKKCLKTKKIIDSDPLYGYVKEVFYNKDWNIKYTGKVLVYPDSICFNDLVKINVICERFNCLVKIGTDSKNTLFVLLDYKLPNPN